MFTRSAQEVVLLLMGTHATLNAQSILVEDKRTHPKTPYSLYLANQAHSMPFSPANNNINFVVHRASYIVQAGKPLGVLLMQVPDRGRYCAMGFRDSLPGNSRIQTSLVHDLLCQSFEWSSFPRGSCYLPPFFWSVVPSGSRLLAGDVPSRRM